MGSQVSPVCWDNSAFEPLGENSTLVGTKLAITETLALDPNVQMTCPYTIGAVGMEEVSVHSIVYVSPKYVPLVIHGDLTPRQ